jgi:threonine synthase
VDTGVTGFKDHSISGIMIPMRFRSTHSSESLVSFKDAVLHCLPPDGGLYVPDRAMDIRQLFLYMDEETGFSDLVAAVAPSLLEGGLNPLSASRVAESAFNFEPELIRLDDDYSLLNLCKGPTGLYKDFGIAFLAAVLEELHKDSPPLLVLAAALADTGVSMAHAFGGRKGMSVVLVYPAGRTTEPPPAIPSAVVSNGGNIIPIQVQGTFDDCQRLVNETINDRTFAARYHITGANTVNPGRLLPQAFYYLYAFIKIKKQLSGGLAFSVPCGNFGNFIAGLYAWKFGMPVNGFIAAMNANNALGDFIKGGAFIPCPVIKTNSPALDVSIPLNFSRLESFYREAPAVMRNMVYPASVDDELTLRTMERVWKKYHLHIDSNTAVAFAAAEQTAAGLDWKGNVHTVVLATRHYAREAELIRTVTGETVPEMQPLQQTIEPVAVISPNLDAFQGIISRCFQ